MISLPFFQKNPKVPNKFITLTFNSKDVKCTVFFADGRNLKIIGFGSYVLEEESVRNGIIIDQEDVEKAANEALIKATENIEDRVDSVIFGTNNATCLGLTTTMRYKRKTSEPLSRNEVLELYKRVSDAAYIEAENEYLNITGNPDENLETITTSDVYLKIDGVYEKDLENKQGQMVEAAIYHAFAPEFHVKTVQGLCKKLGLNLLAVGSEMYSTVQWMRRTSPEFSDYIIIDVAEDASNIAIVFGNGIVATKTVSVGYKHFVISISDRMGVTMSEAEKLFKSYLSKTISESEMVLIGDCVKETARIWLLGMEIAFNEFAGVKTFASKLFVLGAGSYIPEIVEGLTSEIWAKNIAFKEPPTVSLIESEKLPVSDSTGMLKGKEWINNLMLSIIFEEIFGDSQNDKA